MTELDQLKANKNRKIKFRIWDNKAENMAVYSPDLLCVALEEPDQFTLLQYTGLTDKNGVEIYEGDIVDPQRVGALYLTVRWSKIVSGFGLYSFDDFYGYLGESNALEVIGNIYENPELLS